MLRIKGKSNYEVPEEEMCSFTLVLNINFALCLVVCSSVSGSAVARLTPWSQDKSTCILQEGVWIAMSLGSH